MPRLVVVAQLPLYDKKPLGQRVGGAFHTQKANDSITELQRWIDKNPQAMPRDKAAAENVILDMSNALKGK